LSFREKVEAALLPLGGQINGDPQKSIPQTLNISIPGISAESAMVVLKGLIAISNGSACTSQSYEPSHVLKAMGLPEQRIKEALRISWCHLTEEVNWGPVVNALKALQ
jgi:cysteine desulfurase